MQRQDSGQLSRRDFLGHVVIGGAGLILGCNSSAQLLAQAKDGPGSRRIWAFADSHIGLGGRGNDGRDGAEWLELCLKDVRERIAPADYVLALGDVTDDRGREDQLRRYVQIRDDSGLPGWYELAGNHDHGAIPAGRWRRLVKRPVRYALIDGTAAWFFISSEQGKSDGKVSPLVARWLMAEIARHQDKRNIIVCSHQAVYGTVSGSASSSACLNHRKLVAQILRTVRVDLWLCGHIHAGRRHAGYLARRGRTTFINVASAGHAYGTGACNGYILEMSEKSNAMLARCRDHERGVYVKDQQTRIEFPHAWRFFAKPVLLPARMGRSSRQLSQRDPALGRPVGEPVLA